MSNVKKIIGILFLSTFVWLTGFSQQSGFEHITKKFNTYREQTLQEKIYVHTDRSTYLTGETVWFKVYLTDGSLHKPLDLSKVVYLEITDAHHHPVLQTKISIESGVGSGSLYLPPTINSGNYFLRAYTSWMKNFSSDFFFNKTITIINTFKPLDEANVKPSTAVDLQFFPEGGNLIHGLASKVAFRAVDEYGKGIQFSGVILNHHNDTIASITPVKFGMGSFIFTPQPGEQYYASIRQPSGKYSRHNIPSALENGYTLSLTDDEKKITVRVHTNLSSASTQLPVYLFVHARNITSVSAVKDLTNNNCTFEIDTSILPEGISHITLFDADLHPVCERLFFKQPENILDIAIKTDEYEYLSRRKVILDLKTLKRTNAPVSSNLSASIYKLDSLPQHSGNMITSFWLTSDLKGTIESPEYYFSTHSEEVRIAADLLMLTHGWRRFRWDDILQEHINTPFIPELRGPVIKGTVLNENGTPASGVLAYLSTPGKMIRVNTALSTDAGEIIFEMQKFRGAANVIVQTNYKKDSTHRILLANPYSQEPLSKVAEPFQLSPGHAQRLLDRSVAMQVQDIYYEEKLEISAQKISDSSAFYGKGDEVYQLDAYTRFPVMEEVMREYVKGVWVRNRKDGFHFRLVDKVNNSVFEASPLLLLDGVPFFNEDEIMHFNPLNVRQLDVITRRYYLGPASFPGVVSFRTYAGDLAGFQLNPRSIKINYEGLQQKREFYSPRYDNVSSRKSRMPDQRTLLYWNPDVRTDSKGEFQLEFFTSDVSGIFQVEVEGITNEGTVGSSTTFFRVK